MMVLVDMSYCSTNTKRRRMDLSARQKNTSCNDDMIKPASKKSTKYQMSYGQIRYLMKSYFSIAQETITIKGPARIDLKNKLSYSQ